MYADVVFAQAHGGIAVNSAIMQLHANQAAAQDEMCSAGRFQLEQCTLY